MRLLAYLQLVWRGKAPARSFDQILASDIDELRGTIKQVDEETVKSVLYEIELVSEQLKAANIAEIDILHELSMYFEKKEKSQHEPETAPSLEKHNN